jgi:hypothetical protein
MLRCALMAAFLVLCLALTGCGGSSDGTSSESSPSSDSASEQQEGGGADAAKPFEISESEYRISSSLGDTYVHWTAIIRNPNTDVYGIFPTLSITGRDSAGKVVGTEDQVLDSLPPGGTIAFSSQVSMTEKPAKVEIAYKSIDWYDTKTAPDDYPPFAVADTRYKKQQLGGLVVTGEVSNPYEYAVDSLAATALFRDADGTLVGGTTSFLEDLPASGTMPLQLEELGGRTPPGKVKSAEVLVSTWSDPETWNQLAQGKDPAAE